MVGETTLQAIHRESGGTKLRTLRETARAVGGRRK